VSIAKRLFSKQCGLEAGVTANRPNQPRDSTFPAGWPGRLPARAPSDPDVLANLANPVTFLSRDDIPIRECGFAAVAPLSFFER